MTRGLQIQVSVDEKVWGMKQAGRALHSQGQPVAIDQLIQVIFDYNDSEWSNHSLFIDKIKV